MQRVFKDFLKGKSATIIALWRAFFLPAGGKRAKGSGGGFLTFMHGI